MGISGVVDTLPAPGDVLSREASNRGRRLTFVVVFATILIDFVGFSVLIPVLPLFADRLGASSLQVGWIVALYALAQLVFLPVWGWVSDRVGRRPVLLISLLGTAVSFAVLAAAQSIAVVYAARVLAGLFAASVGTAQAVVTDLTPPTERTRGMGLIGAAFGVSMVVGPALGGALAALHEQAPFYAIVIVAGASFLLAWRALPESRPAGLPRPPWRDLARSFVPTPLRLFARVHDRRIALFLVLFFVFFAAFAVVEAMGTLYLGKRFGADELDAALVFAWIGLFIAGTQAGPLGRLVDWFGEVRLLVIGFALMAVGIAAVAGVPVVRLVLRGRARDRGGQRARLPFLHQSLHPRVPRRGSRGAARPEQLHGHGRPHRRRGGRRRTHVGALPGGALPRIERAAHARARALPGAPPAAAARNRAGALGSARSRRTRPRVPARSAAAALLSALACG